jgi:hypothetical protein
VRIIFESLKRVTPHQTSSRSADDARNGHISKSYGVAVYFHCSRAAKAAGLGAVLPYPCVLERAISKYITSTIVRICVGIYYLSRIGVIIIYSVILEECELWTTPVRHFSIRTVSNFLLLVGSTAPSRIPHASEQDISWRLNRGIVNAMVDHGIQPTRYDERLLS